MIIELNKIAISKIRRLLNWGLLDLKHAHLHLYIESLEDVTHRIVLDDTSCSAVTYNYTYNDIVQY